MSLTTKEIKRLVKLSKRKDKQAFSDLYEEYYKKILYYSLKRVLKIEASQDITSNVFLKVIKGLDKFKWKGGGFNGWIYMIATNEINTYFRGLYKDKVVYCIDSFEEMEDLKLSQQKLDERLVKNVLFKKVSEKIKLLKPAYQDILTLRYFQEMSHKEIAEILNKNPNTIRVYLQRAVKELKELI